MPTDQSDPVLRCQPIQPIRGLVPARRGLECTAYCSMARDVKRTLCELGWDWQDYLAQRSWNGMAGTFEGWNGLARTLGRKEATIRRSFRRPRKLARLRNFAGDTCTKNHFDG